MAEQPAPELMVTLYIPEVVTVAVLLSDPPDCVAPALNRYVVPVLPPSAVNVTTELVQDKGPELIKLAFSEQTETTLNTFWN